MSENTTCPFCGVDYSSEGEYPSDQYMYEGHIILECEEVPQEERDYINEPNLKND